MLRRALLLALLPAVAIFAGCSDHHDDHGFRPIVTTTLISNLSSTESTAISVDSGRVAAVGFRMPDSSYSLTSARLKLQVGSNASDSIVVRLFRDSLGNPGTPIFTFLRPVFIPENNQPATSTFFPPTLYTLRADSTYWIVVYNRGGGFVGWTTDGTPTGIATFVGSRVDNTGAPNPPTTPSGAIGQFSVIGTRINP